MPGTRSSAETNCISEVPGFIRQRFTSLASRVLSRHSAPFISYLFIKSHKHFFALSGINGGVVRYRRQEKRFCQRKLFTITRTTVLTAVVSSNAWPGQAQAWSGASAAASPVHAH